MRYKLYTVIDITETGARKGDLVKAQQQQQNFLTVVQTISLRSNPIISHKPTLISCKIDGLGFGSDLNGNHNVWHLNFEFENESHSLEFLNIDLNCVPVIAGLNETIQLHTPAFFTLDPKLKNIVFEKFE